MWHKHHEDTLDKKEVNREIKLTIPDEDIDGWNKSLSASGLDTVSIQRILTSKNATTKKQFIEKIFSFEISNGNFDKQKSKFEQEIGRQIEPEEIEVFFEKYRLAIEEALKVQGFSE